MSRDPRLFLEDIQGSCLKILQYTQDLDFASFCADEKTKDAVIRNLTIIGEAVKHIPEEIRKPLLRGELAGYCRTKECRCARIFWRR